MRSEKGIDFYFLCCVCINGQVKSSRLCMEVVHVCVCVCVRCVFVWLVNRFDIRESIN
jgi:hypothetical protein